MNNNLQLVLKSSTTEMSLNDHDAGIYIVPELDGLTGLPEIRTTSGVNAGYDGGWTSAQKFDARSIVIRGVIANEDKTEVERMRRELVALLAQGKNEQLELDFVTETGRAYEVQVRTIACDMAMQRVLTQQEFMITLRADDPLIYDNSSAGEEATVNVSGATGGFRIPFEIPLAIDAGSEETVVQNSGLESVAPTIKMYGALHNPKIINHTTNQAMQVEAELGFTEGAWTTPVDAPEGTNVSFEPEREAPIESAKLKGDTYQQTYTGKNLTPYPYSEYALANGVAFSSDTDGSVVLNGQNNGSANSAYFLFRNDNSPIELPAGTYSFIPPSNTAVGYVLVVGSTYLDFNAGNNYTRTLNSAQSVRQIYVQVLRGSTATFNNLKVYPMLSTLSGQTEADYEPYVGGVPAPNPDYPQAVQTVTGENVVKICGKNLFDKNAISTGYLNADGTLSSDQAYKTSDFIAVKPNTAYYKTYTASPRTKYYNSTRQPLNTTTYQDISIGGAAGTFTTPANAAYVRFSFPVAGINLDTTQLELGSTATAYEPYQEQSYPISLGSIELCGLGDDGAGGYLYRDGIYKNLTENKWYVHKATNKIVYDGTNYKFSSRSGTGTSGKYRFVLSGTSAEKSIAKASSTALFDGLCNILVSGTRDMTYTLVGKDVIAPIITAGSYGDIGVVYIDAISAMSVDDANTWLGTHNMTVYYALATPTDTEITNQALIAQLEALVDGNAVVYEGETNIAITAAAGNMPGIAAIRYYTDKEPDQRDELIIDSRLKTITLNGLDVYHLQAPGSEFLMLAPGENKLSLQSDITGDNGYAKVSYKQGYLSI